MRPWSRLEERSSQIAPMRSVVRKGDYLLYGKVASESTRENEKESGTKSVILLEFDFVVPPAHS